MRRLIPVVIIAALAIALVPAADQPAPVQLDPTKAADAVQIVDGLTRQLALPRDQAVALTIAIQTLGTFVRDQAKPAMFPVVTPVPPKKD